jgi:amidohydrolase
MDALPIQEIRDIPWKSIHDGRMHACGHDGHMAILLGTANYLQNNRDNFAGNIKLIFQPAEEGLGGAQKMIQDGLFERHRMDAVYALHNWPDMPVGEIGMCDGPIMAASNRFKYNIEGKSCHAAFPERGINAGLMASEVFALTARLYSSLGINEAGVVSPTVISAGDAPNVVPEDAVVRGTIRTLTPTTLTKITQGIERIASDVSRSFGGKVTVDFNTIGIPTVNDPKETNICREAALKVFGQDGVKNVQCAMTSEDFGYMLDKVQGTYMWLGQGLPNDPDSPHNRSLHNANYEFNDAIIEKGIELFANIAERRLSL